MMGHVLPTAAVQVAAPQPGNLVLAHPLSAMHSELGLVLQHTAAAAMPGTRARRLQPGVPPPHPLPVPTTSPAVGATHLVHQADTTLPHQEPHSAVVWMLLPLADQVVHTQRPHRVLVLPRRLQHGLAVGELMRRLHLLPVLPRRERTMARRRRGPTAVRQILPLDRRTRMMIRVIGFTWRG